VNAETILYVVVRDRNRRVAHKAVGSALVQADREAGITTFALRKGIEPLTAFLVDSPAQAERAKRVLGETERRSCAFYLVEALSGEDLGFAGPALDGGVQPGT